MARCELHGKVARWLSGLTGSRANDFLGITAEHYERAGDVASAAEFHAVVPTTRWNALRMPLCWITCTEH